MRGLRRNELFFELRLRADSPLREVDPRVKLWLGLAASFGVMLPLERLAVFTAVYLVFLTWSRLLGELRRQVLRMKWALILLFALDWWVGGAELAAVITLRVILLAGVFGLFFSTTSPGEMGLALEKMGLPYRYAFSINLAFQSLGLLQEEWLAIREAQASRGVLPAGGGLRSLLRQVGDWVALTVPAIVLATRRAWAVTEAAYARGFDSPKRVPFLQLHIGRLDWACALLSTLLMAGFWLWR